MTCIGIGCLGSGLLVHEQIVPVKFRRAVVSLAKGKELAHTYPRGTGKT